MPKNDKFCQREEGRQKLCQVLHRVVASLALSTTLPFLSDMPNKVKNVEGAAENARSREKTGLKAIEGDEDLVDYYYLCMHPNTQHGLDLRKTDAKRFRTEVMPNLKERFPETALYPHWCNQDGTLKRDGDTDKKN